MHAASAVNEGSAATARRRVLLLVLDGMQPGSITPELTPRLASLAASGVTYTRSRTGFPSETMVGAGELFTGSWPERSGITSNWMMVPGGARRGTELKSLAGIQQLADAYGGRALASPSMFDALTGAALTSAVIGKEGPAELASLGGATWSVSTGATLESELGRRIGAARGAAPLGQLVHAAAGAAPASGSHDDAARSDWLVRSAAAVDAALAPDLLTVWLTDPDKTQHRFGLGTANQRSALRQADAAVGRLLDQLAASGGLADTDIVVTSDHGFSDHVTRHEVPLDATLREAGIDVSHVVASGNQHLVRFAHTPTRADFARLRAAIATSPIAGLVRTIVENPREATWWDRRDDAHLTGRDLRQGSERAADAYVIYRDDESGAGAPGRNGRGSAHVPANPGSTVAGHGSLGWSDINNTLVVAGPRFERAGSGSAPLRTANAAGIVDVAPTILHLLGVEAPAAMQGRVLHEALVERGRDGVVDELAARTNVATSHARFGARAIRTELLTEVLPSGHSYFAGMRTDETRTAER